MVKRLLVALLALVWLVGVAPAQTVSVLPNAMQQFVDGNGAPYAGGHVYMYVPNTTTPKATYQTPLGTSPNSNPITLDANGRAVIWGSGEYRQILQDLNGTVVWDQLTYAAPVTAAAGSTTLWYGTATGTANSITLATPAGFTAVDGQTVAFLALATNTGPVTVNASGYGSIVLVKNTSSGPTVLSGGEIVAGNLVTATYSSALNEFVAANLYVPFPRAWTLNVLDYGADPTDTSYNDTAFSLWWTACMTSGVTVYGARNGGNDCFMPRGLYKFQYFADWDFKNNVSGGAVVHGAGAVATTLDFTGGSGAYLYIHDSYGGGEGYFYPDFNNFGVIAANTTVADKAALQVDEDPNINVSDICNECRFDSLRVVNNTGCAAGTTSLAMNGFYNSVLRATVNLGGCSSNSAGAGTNPAGGSAMRLDACAFSTIQGSYSNATEGIYITGPSSNRSDTYNCLFLNLDMELVYYPVLIDAPFAYNLTFLNPQLIFCNSNTSCPSGTGYAFVIDSNATGIIEDNGNISSIPNTAYSGGTYAQNLLIRDVRVGVSTGTVAATTVVTANTSNRRVLAVVTGNSTTKYCYGVGAGLCSNTPTSSNFSFVLSPTDSYSFTYTGAAPTMLWIPVE